MRKRRLWTAVTVLALLLTGGLLAQPARADTYTVTTTANSGTGSLRWAIEQANSNTGADLIAFNIPTSDPGYKTATGVWTIQPSSPLPYLTDSGTTIDGTTQPGFGGSPIIEIEGTQAGIAAGLRIESADNTVKGLVINRFIMQGILIYGSEALGNIITDNSRPAVCQSHHAVCVGADVVANDQVVVRFSDLNAVKVIPRDYVPLPGRRTTNGVVMGATRDLDTLPLLSQA